MSVLLETTKGDLVVDTDCEAYPVEAFNFLKLCKSGFFRYQCFYNLQKSFSIECGDALVGNNLRDSLRFHSTSIQGLAASEKQGSGQLLRSSAPFQKTRRAQLGDVAFLTSIVEGHVPVLGSKFMFSLAEDGNTYEDVVVFGKVTAESLGVLQDWSNQTVDKECRPEVDIRIKNAYILHDPFPDPEGFKLVEVGLPLEDVRLPPEMIAIETNKLDSTGKSLGSMHSKEVTLEILGDIPHVGIKPSDRVLFICKLNPMTKAKDLAVIFHRFGTIDTIEIVHDKETGASLCYGFIEFADNKSCEMAYFKMEGVLIDDRRVHVDFCQSSKKITQQH
ncbi:LADA_0H02740g1_1 [Lachancea dasiensis]|uniref:Peptidyl-prolyl cis-trans isomerase n=1 Tax=Lachancea dasiensis TaxID=1072105 RepID=A0A1G4JZV2_9SACH|nr:LADA_0H02740g1_1 [Lachancea dasiensis]